MVSSSMTFMPNFVNISRMFPSLKAGHTEKTASVQASLISCVKRGKNTNTCVVCYRFVFICRFTPYSCTIRNLDVAQEK